jgi:hypothetical protein
MKKGHLLVGVLAVLLAFPALAQQRKSSPGAGARMYKCIDEAGKVYYSDKPRSDCIKAAEMNRQGVIVPKPGDKALKTTATPVAATKEAPAGRRDRALMATYTSESEIDAARDRSLQMPLQSIKALEAKNEKAGAELFELKKQADVLASKQQPLPADLLDEVQAKQKQQAGLETELNKKKAEAEQIRSRYEADKVRYRELKGTPAAATASAAK